MYRVVNRCRQYLDGTANAKTHQGCLGEGFALMSMDSRSHTMGNGLADKGQINTDVSEQFGRQLRTACSGKGLDREAFIAKACKKFRDLNDVTPGRWYDGRRLPRRACRSWFSEEFGIEIPGSRTGDVKVRTAEPPPVNHAPPADLMAYAVGSIQKAVQSTDAQIIHEVQDSLKDPVQNPWMRIAVTLIRNAHQR
jgi:hypothetical protein